VPQLHSLRQPPIFTRRIEHRAGSWYYLPLATPEAKGPVVVHHTGGKTIGSALSEAITAKNSRYGNEE
jgi:hypothetical protein